MNLFFHFGPGGHPHLEKNWFEVTADDIDYFDLSALPTKPKSIDEMAEIYHNHIVSTYDKPLVGWAHSFGCDVLWVLAARHPELFKEIHLISPIRDVQRGLLNLCSTIAAQESDQDLENQVQHCLANFSEEAFWQCVQIAASHSNFFRTYWHSDEDFEKWLKLQKQFPALDFTYWTQFLNQYAPIQSQTYSKSVDLDTTVYLGTKDPYLREDDFKYWNEKVGENNIIICDHSAHHPHLEEPELVPMTKSEK